MKRAVIIFYENKPLVIAMVEDPFLSKWVLDQYAEDYAFDRKKLSTCVLDYIDMGKLRKVTEKSN